MAEATFAAGCFWGVEEAFRQLPGVTATTVGYTGGTAERPSYEDVCAGGTGHAEAVRVEYDPARLSYEDLLATFWKIHDPTTVNRQGPDIGAQYRSAVFFHDAAQEREARTAAQRLQASGRIHGRVVTEIVPAGPFWPAEEYHQKYVAKRYGRL